MTRFTIRCSRAIFSAEEIKILERYGHQFEQLTNGERQPETEAQEQFVEAARGRREAETIYERTWAKYMFRVKWEREPKNRAAMGDRRRMPNDREDWKRMSGAVWGGMVQRARGRDD